ncbi:MAG: glycosyltransferase family 2 protein [Candidatus Nomurabacteria bacterium]|nr:glycosyltransferase family 2 protein [Candidatus Nomurabacteria bacterium]
MHIKLSIIIVNWNTKDILKQTIESVKKETSLFEYEIIVIDNNSTDDSVNMIKTLFPSIKIIENQDNFGFGFANNQGLKIATRECILFLNSDTIILENAIEKLVRFLDENKDIAMVGPKILNKDRTFQSASKRNLPTIKNSFQYLFLNKKENNYKLENEGNISEITEAISGACMLVRHSIYKKIGGFDEQFFMYAEDLDYCKRILDNGFKIYYLSTAEIIHLGGESTKKNTESLKYFYKTMWLYYKKYFYNNRNLFVNFSIYIGIKILYFYKKLF